MPAKGVMVFKLEASLIFRMKIKLSLWCPKHPLQRLAEDREEGATAPLHRAVSFSHAFVSPGKSEANCF